MTYFSEWREEVIEYLGGHCVKCGTTEKEGLEFDHVDETTKLFCVSGHWSMADKSTLKTEIDKCQILCKECHLDKTKRYLSELGFERGVTHGSIYAWMKKKCVCEICKQAKVVWDTERNAKRRKGGGRGSYSKNPDHGTTARYCRGCRCTECRAANALREKNRKTARRARTIECGIGGTVDTDDLKSSAQQ